MKHFLFIVLFLLCSCIQMPQDDIVSRANTRWQDSLFRNPFPAPNLPVLPNSNADLARDFLDLSFSLESGRALPMLTRFEGPISVHLSEHAAESLPSDLNRLIRRLRTEAGLEIFLTQSKAANITIQSVSRAQLRKALPNAACFVVPNVNSLRDFQLRRNSKAASWPHQTERHKVMIFLPSDATPQEVRDCLHEEFAQALGPLNDLYRLPNSVFNDDNVHTVLTSFDMLILKITYASDLHSGMSRTQVQDRLPAILNKINPRGISRSPNNLKPTPRVWINLIQTSFSPDISISRRHSAARQSVSVAQTNGWHDHRLGLSYFSLALITQSQDIKKSESLFKAAMENFRRNPQSRLHRAYTASHLASYALIDNRPQYALDMVEPNIKIAWEFENATLLATLLLLKAEALDNLGRGDEARSVRLDSSHLAGYGFGSGRAWNTKRRAISELSAGMQNGG